MPRDTLPRHLTEHKNHRLTRPLVAKICTELDNRYPRIAASDDALFENAYCPSLADGPLPHLPILTGYYGCKFGDGDSQETSADGGENSCTFVAPTVEIMKQHCRSTHGWRARSGRPRGDRALVPWTSNITCQRLRKTSPGKKPFQVSVNTADLLALEELENEEVNLITHSDSTKKDISDRLATEEAKLAAFQSTSLTDGGLKVSATHRRSPWLELTQWSTYFSGVNLLDAARLINLPRPHELASSTAGDQVDEEILLSITHAFDRLIKEARDTLTLGRLNIFDQYRVSSFQRGQSYRRPIFTKLLDGTYKRYKVVWKQLLCYVIRILHFREGPILHHRATPSQLTTFDRLLTANQARKKLERKAREHSNPSSLLPITDHQAATAEAQTHLRRCCLDFCIALLDHKLRGNIYDSLIVSFLTVKGINVNTCCFQEPANYTSGLSALIKLAQYLIAHRSIIGAAEGEVDFPSELLDTMQDRFMVIGSRSPIEWALKLRRYGRSVRDTTTAHGMII